MLFNQVASYEEGKCFYKLPIFIKLTNFSEFIEGTISLKVAGHLEISLETPLRGTWRPGLVLLFTKNCRWQFQLFFRELHVMTNRLSKTDDRSQVPKAVISLVINFWVYKYSEIID